MHYEDDCLSVIGRFAIGALIGALIGFALYQLSFFLPSWIYDPYADTFMVFFTLFFVMLLIGILIGGCLVLLKVENFRRGFVIGTIGGTVLGLPMLLTGTIISWLIFGTGGGAIIGVLITGVIKASKMMYKKSPFR